jgi:hypothetical protein
VVVVAPGSECDCVEAATVPSPSQWTWFEHAVAQANTSGIEAHIRFSLGAVNIVGLASEAGPFEVLIEPPLVVPPLSFGEPSLEIRSAAVATCGLSLTNNLSALHPAGRQLLVGWDAYERGLGERDDEVPTYRVCVDGTSCRTALASDPSTLLPPLDAGLHVVNVSAVGVSGLVSVGSTYLVVADASPPLFNASAVRIGEHAEFWGSADGLRCSFAKAVDPESGLRSYEVTLVKVQPRCGECKRTGLGGKVIAHEDVLCAEGDGEAEVSVDLHARLEHGSSYRCLVTAVNGAGLSTRRSSMDVVADLSRGSYGLGEHAVVLDHSGGHAAYVSNETLLIEFVMDAALDHLDSDTAAALQPLSPIEVVSLELLLLSFARGANASTAARRDEPFTRLNCSRTIRVGSEASPCCASSPLPPTPATSHDAWIVPAGWPFASPSSVAQIGSTFLVAAGRELFALVAPSPDDMPVGGAPPEQVQYVHISSYAECNASITIVGAYANAWGIYACGTLSILASPPVAVDVSQLAVDGGCVTAKIYFALSSDCVYAWRICNRTGSLVQLPFSGASETLLLERDVQPAACLECLSTNGVLLALQQSDNCSLGGAVALFRVETDDSTTLVATVSEPHLTPLLPLGWCGFGRVTLLVADVLLVGAPDADGGAGLVSVWDVSKAAAPVWLCHWTAPGALRGFGASLAARPRDEDDLQLIAVGSAEDSTVVVEQVVYASPGVPTCDPAGKAVAVLLANELTAGPSPPPMHPLSCTKACYERRATERRGRKNARCESVWVAQNACSQRHYPLLCP